MSDFGEKDRGHRRSGGGSDGIRVRKGENRGVHRTRGVQGVSGDGDVAPGEQEGFEAESKRDQDEATSAGQDHVERVDFAVGFVDVAL